MEIISHPKQEFSVLLKLTEQEAGALHDIVAYGYKPFMGVFKEKLGKAYIEKHEKGAESLFKVVYEEMPKHFARFSEARAVFDASKYKSENEPTIVPMNVAGVKLNLFKRIISKFLLWLI